MKTRLTLTFLVVLLCRMSNVAAQTSATTVPDPFRGLYVGPLMPDREEGLRKALPCDRITLERTGGMVIGTAYKLTLSKDGSATLHGNVFGQMGESTGAVNLIDFGKLCHLSTRIGLDRLAPSYKVGWTDMTTLTVTVTSGDKSVAVADYGGAGPVDLWALQRAIEAVAYKIRWTSK